MEKEKPILATNLDGFLIDHEAFIEPHRIWFDRASLLTKDDSFQKWKGHRDYFKGVNEAMKKIMPDASQEERTKQARKWYQEDVVHYIKLHPEMVNQELKKSLEKLKQRFTLALIITSTQEYINDILEAANLKGLYDIIYSSELEEEPSKRQIVEEFKEKYGNPKYYVASKSNEAFEEFPKIGTMCVYFVPKEKGDEIDQEAKNLASKTITNTKDLENLNGV